MKKIFILLFATFSIYKSAFCAIANPVSPINQPNANWYIVRANAQLPDYDYSNYNRMQGITTKTIQKPSSKDQYSTSKRVIETATTNINKQNYSQNIRNWQKQTLQSRTPTGATHYHNYEKTNKNINNQLISSFLLIGLAIGITIVWGILAHKTRDYVEEIKHLFPGINAKINWVLCIPISIMLIIRSMIIASLGGTHAALGLYFFLYIYVPKYFVSKRIIMNNSTNRCLVDTLLTSTRTTIILFCGELALNALVIKLLNNMI